MKRQTPSLSDDEYLATQEAAQSPATFLDHGNCFGLVLRWDGERVVGVEEVESSPVLQIEQTFKAHRRHVFGLVEHHAPLPAPKTLRVRHAADMLFTDHRTRRFVADAIEAKIKLSAEPLA